MHHADEVLFKWTNSVLVNFNQDGTVFSSNSVTWVLALNQKNGISGTVAPQFSSSLITLQSPTLHFL